ncbi:hypothetical protein SAMN04489762_3475 [Terribacillus saccharophilus]|uniref:Plantaricin C family lantibiotic n=1 Tax=Terribacillus saccharophilus TaxID=361277 RepID=A0AAX2EJW4_9BACI|nr:hypothetical protein SAMN04489762_3475 [Terribacillus saccharophilus]
MESKFIKNFDIQNKYSVNEKNPAGNLFEEISEQDLSLTSGGTSDAVSKVLANRWGLAGNYGQVCTLSAECALGQAC